MSLQYPMRIGPGSISSHYMGNQYPTIKSSPFPLQVNGHYYSMIFSLEKSTQVTDVGFYIMVSGTNSQFLFDLVSLDTLGNPSNTNYGGSSGTVSQASDLVEGWNWVSLSTSATGTAGDIVAARVKVLNATTSNYILVSGVKTHRSNLPRTRNSTEIVAEHPIVGVKYTDEDVQGMPLSGANEIVYNSGSDPDEYGVKFSVPIDMSCIGASIVGKFSSNSAFRILLYNDTQVVRAVSVPDEDHVNSSSATTLGSEFQIRWPSYDLVSGGTYRITIQPNTISDNATIYEQSLVTSSYSYVLPGGDYWQETYRTDSGTFTNVPNKKMWMSILVKDISPSTGTSTTTTIIAGEGAHAWAY